MMRTLFGKLYDLHNLLTVYEMFQIEGFELKLPELQYCGFINLIGINWDVISLWSHNKKQVSQLKLAIT